MEVEGLLQLKDGLQLYTKTWKPSGDIKAKVIFVHGLNNHCNAYYDFFPNLAATGIEVFGFDGRGWGRSVTNEASKGAEGNTTQVMQDLNDVVSSQLPSPVPLFLMGSSKGGGEVLTFACTGSPDTIEQIRGFIGLCPIIEIHPSSAASWITRLIGGWASLILPNYQIKLAQRSENLSRDLQVQNNYTNDKLNHGLGTLAGLTGILSRAQALQMHYVQPNQRVRSILVAHGTADMTVSADASEAWVAKIDVKDKEYRGYEGYRHQLSSEPNGDGLKFQQELSQWILARK